MTDLEEFSSLSMPDAALHGMNAVGACICLIGLTGNILVFFVIYRNASLHTVSNLFIVMLIISDIIALLNVPAQIATSVLSYWPFGNAYCKIYLSFAVITQFATNFFLVTLSADRYVVICQPSFARKTRTMVRAVVVCCAVWMLAIILTTPVFIYAGTDPDNVHHCTMQYRDPSFNGMGSRLLGLYCFSLSYAIPVILMLTFYGLLIKKLIEQRNRISAVEGQNCWSDISSTDRRLSDRLRKVTVMILVIAVIHLICWTPHWSNQLYLFFADTSDKERLTTIYVTISLQFLCLANSAINPFLYAFLSENFKQNCKAAFCKQLPNDDQAFTEEVIYTRYPNVEPVESDVNPEIPMLIRPSSRQPVAEADRQSLIKL